MTGERRLAMAVVTAFCLLSAEARAASFHIVGGTLHQTPARIPDTEEGWWVGNDVISSEWGYIGAQLGFAGVGGQSYLFTFEFRGFEALWLDTLETGGGAITNRATVGSSVAFSMVASGGADIVPFSFLVRPDPSVVYAMVTNGANPYPLLLAPNFFLSIADPTLEHGTTLLEGDVAWLALDDSGAGPDVDHDDWVGLVRVTPAPEPGSLALLGGGLLAAAGRLRHGLGRRGAPARRSLAGRTGRA